MIDRKNLAAVIDHCNMNDFKQAATALCNKIVHSKQLTQQF